MLVDCVCPDNARRLAKAVHRITGSKPEVAERRGQFALTFLDRPKVSINFWQGERMDSAMRRLAMLLHHRRDAWRGVGGVG